MVGFLNQLTWKIVLLTLSSVIVFELLFGLLRCRFFIWFFWEYGVKSFASFVELEIQQKKMLKKKKSCLILFEERLSV